MTEKQLNNFMLLHVYKDLTDETIDNILVAKKFTSVNPERMSFFSTIY